MGTISGGFNVILIIGGVILAILNAGFFLLVGTVFLVLWLLSKFFGKGWEVIH